MVMDAEGNAIASSDPAVQGRNFKFRQYFKAAMEGQSFMTGIIVGAVAGAAGVFYSRRSTRRTARPCSAPWCCASRPSPSAKMLAAAQVGKDRIPFLVDGDGVIVWHPNEKVMFSSLLPLPKAKLEEIVADQRFRRQKIDALNMPSLARRP
jgi:C4-dicarboxylate-specific signal transduction histidine kinase